jgi:hypothetical protein
VLWNQIQVKQVDGSQNRLMSMIYSEDDEVRERSPMQEFRTAMAYALGLAVTCFGAALFAANFIVK